MASFRDTSERSWDFSITVSSIKRVRSLVGVDLMDMVDGKLVEEFLTDPVLLVDALYALCKPQADDLGVSDEEFGEAMSGDVIDHATKALILELIRFFPNTRDRKNLKRVMETTWEVMERARDVVEERFNNGELDRIADQAVKSLGEQFTSQQES